MDLGPLGRVDYGDTGLEAAWENVRISGIRWVDGAVVDDDGAMVN